jgi:hypothetical protein
MDFDRFPAAIPCGGATVFAGVVLTDFAVEPFDGLRGALGGFSGVVAEVFDNTPDEEKEDLPACELLLLVDDLERLLRRTFTPSTTRAPGT